MAQLMQWCAALLAGWLVAGAGAAAAAHAEPTAPSKLLVLAYHDIVADGQPAANPDAVSASTLARHFAWLKSNGYRTVSLRELARARAGLAALPERPVLLMFDDGYASFAQRVMPLLQAYDFRAVLAVVASWLEPTSHHEEEDQSGEPRDGPVRAALLSAAQVAEVARSERVEIASHSLDLHRGLRIDSVGAVLPAASAPRYDPVSRAFESPEAFEARVRADLRASRERLSALAGRPVDALVWPYGRTSLAAERIAREEGFAFTFSLGDGLTDWRRMAGPLERKYITRATTSADFAWYVRRDGEPAGRVAAVQAAPNEASDAEFAAWRDAVVTRVRAAGATRVVLLPADAETLAQCRFDPAALAADAALARANHLSWHLMRRAGVALVVALPSPDCLERHAWERLAIRMLETRPLDAVQLLTRTANPGNASGDATRTAQDWLRERYPGLPVLDPASAPLLAPGGTP